MYYIDVAVQLVKYFTPAVKPKHWNSLEFYIIWYCGETWYITASPIVQLSEP